MPLNISPDFLSKFQNDAKAVAEGSKSANQAWKDAREKGFKGSFAEYNDVINSMGRTGLGLLDLFKQTKGTFSGLFGGKEDAAAPVKEDDADDDKGDTPKKFLGMPMAVGISVTVATVLILSLVIYKVVKK